MDIQEQIKSSLQEATGHKKIEFVNCGASALFAALNIAKRVNPKPFVLVPDQGCCALFQKYPKILNFETKEIKTDFGVLDMDDLTKNARTGSALLLSALAGEHALQDIKAISEVCKQNDCLLILDVSGVIGMERKEGSDADIIICSFGEGKTLNVGYGAFISANEPYFDKLVAMSLTKHNIDFEKLYEKIKTVQDKTTFLLNTVNGIKKDLKEKGFSILHPNYTGVNVIATFNNEEEKASLIEYCKDYHYEYIICPTYHRVNVNAISIEIKQLGKA